MLGVMEEMRKLSFAVVLSMCSALTIGAQQKEQDRLRQSYLVMEEIVGMPDKGIPRDLLNKAECVVVFPSVKKAAFVVVPRPFHRE